MRIDRYQLSIAADGSRDSELLIDARGYTSQRVARPCNRTNRQGASLFLTQPKLFRRALALPFSRRRVRCLSGRGRPLLPPGRELECSAHRAKELVQRLAASRTGANASRKRANARRKRANARRKRASARRKRANATRQHEDATCGREIPRYISEIMTCIRPMHTSVRTPNSARRGTKAVICRSKTAGWPHAADGTPVLPAPWLIATANVPRMPRGAIRGGYGL